MRGYLTIGLAIALAVASIACLSLWKVAGYERGERAKVEGEYSAFKEGVRKAGEEQKAKNDQLLKEREKTNARTLQSLNSRYSDLDARYQRLRGESANSGSRPMPSIPDTARPLDDSARDNRLLEVLRAADQQTATLIELQAWIRDQSKP